MQIECMPGKVAIVLDPPEEKVGLIFKPDTVKGDNHLGTIVAMYTSDMSTLKVGDRVVIPRYAGATTLIDGREILFMKDTDILARLVGELAHVGQH